MRNAAACLVLATLVLVGGCARMASLDMLEFSAIEAGDSEFRCEVHNTSPYLYLTNFETKRVANVVFIHAYADKRTADQLQSDQFRQFSAELQPTDVAVFFKDQKDSRLLWARRAPLAR
ncbi:MAG: hypothetical protein IPM18_17430 [Phycisphaerales bacterium]|nr:hypothetical protein [Phycisphaerales bacterium]